MSSGSYHLCLPLSLLSHTQGLHLPVGSGGRTVRMSGRAHPALRLPRSYIGFAISVSSRCCCRGPLTRREDGASMQVRSCRGGLLVRYVTIAPGVSLIGSRLWLHSWS